MTTIWVFNTRKCEFNYNAIDLTWNPILKKLQTSNKNLPGITIGDHINTSKNT